MNCAKRLISATMNKRIFCFTETDKQWKLTLTYKKLIPEDIGLIFQNINFYDSHDFLFKIKEDGEEFVKRFNLGYCSKCGDINNCSLFHLTLKK